MVLVEDQTSSECSNLFDFHLKTHYKCSHCIMKIIFQCTEFICMIWVWSETYFWHQPASKYQTVNITHICISLVQRRAVLAMDSMGTLTRFGIQGDNSKISNCALARLNPPYRQSGKQPLRMARGISMILLVCVCRLAHHKCKSLLKGLAILLLEFYLDVQIDLVCSCYILLTCLFPF